ncbi:MAG TPA: S53 family peptidase [Dictyobacter sp.]|nr:S53 family peptidase [Dictyobacter sp.]
MISLSRLWSSIPVRSMSVCIGLLLVCMPLAACNINIPNVSNLPVLSNVLPNTSALTPMDLDIPAGALNTPVIGQLADNTQLHIRITLNINPAFYAQTQQVTQSGNSSNLQQLAQKYGLSNADYQKVQNFFHGQGVSLSLSKLRTNLSVNASAGTIAQIMKTQFLVHEYQGHQFFAPDVKQPPKVPQFLANSINAITGLDNYSVSPSHQFTFIPESAKTTQKTNAVNCSPEYQTLLPKEVAHAYGFDQLWQNGLNGKNMTINLVEIDGFYRSDIQNYLQCLQGYTGKVQYIDVDGKPQDQLGESTLDIQMIAGLARAATIRVYQTDGNGENNDIWINVNDELQQIVDDNIDHPGIGSTVSISLGSAESEMSDQDMRAIDSSLQQLTRIEHMTIFAASGDCGAFSSGVFGNLGVSFPASDPWVVSVGGTFLQIDQNEERVNEVAWSDDTSHKSCKNQWGTGGGNSSVFPISNWQKAPGVSTQFSQGMRQVPDVAAVAYGLAVYFKGQWGAVGGTSAAAPIWAAGLALVNEGLIQQNMMYTNTSPELFYTVANNPDGGIPYNDIVSGNNLYYKAAQGWDYTTGLGTPNLVDFYQAVKEDMK